MAQENKIPRSAPKPPVAETGEAGRSPRRPPEHPDLSTEEVQERVWTEPGGEELALREAKTGVDGIADNQSDAVAAETPKENLRRMSDPRAGDHGILGPDDKVGSENAGKNEGLGTGGRFSENGPDGTPD